MMNLARFSLVAAAVWFSTGAALATSYLYLPLKLPRADDVAAFANGIEDFYPRVQIPRERILRFLDRGTNNTAPETWPKLEDSRFSGARLADGVFTDKAGKVYFWTLRSRRVLKIISAEHEQALIQLDK